MTKNEAIELDRSLSIFIGRTIYLLKNNIFTEFNINDVDLYLDSIGFDFDKMNLSILYDYVYINNKVDNPNKLFSMLIDIKISLVECCEKYYQFSLINNKRIKTEKKRGYITEIEAHSVLVDFILRYRSLWDKIMGIIVIIYKKEENYEKFITAKSKKRKFKELFCNHIIWKLIEPYYNKITDFDNEYRTSEAHQVGRAQKYIIFNMDKFMNIEYNYNLNNNHLKY